MVVGRLQECVRLERTAIAMGMTPMRHTHPIAAYLPRMGLRTCGDYFRVGGLFRYRNSF
jgi:hypothetical protein